MTYSILARDARTGDLGVAVQSHFFGVGRLVPWAQAGIGVAVTQSIVEASYGPEGLTLLAQGYAPRAALTRLTSRDPRTEVRQVALMDARGQVAVHTGSACIPAAGHAIGDAVSAHANLVESDHVWPAMVEAFERATGDLARRLMAALEAAERRGGDIRGRQSAALIIVRGAASGRLADDRPLDLRVDDAQDPLRQLGRLIDRASALGGLLRLLETDGLFNGAFTASRHDVGDAIAELDRGQAILGEANLEPTVWKGLLLARVGRDPEAATAFRLAARADDRAPEFVRRLAASGMWVRPLEDLEAVLQSPRIDAGMARASPRAPRRSDGTRQERSTTQ